MKAKTNIKTYPPDFDDETPFGLSDSHEEGDGNRVASKYSTKDLSEGAQSGRIRDERDDVREGSARQGSRGSTSDPFLKDRTAKRAFTKTQATAATAVTKLKQRQTISKGSGLARTRRAGMLGGGLEASPASAPLAIRRVRSLRFFFSLLFLIRSLKVSDTGSSLTSRLLMASRRTNAAQGIGSVEEEASTLSFGCGFGIKRA